MKKNISTRKNLGKKRTLGSTFWVRNRLPCRNRIGMGYKKYYAQLQRMNIRIIAQIKELASQPEDWKDAYLSYLEFQERVLETEVDLLRMGIDTSQYSAFRREEGRDRVQDGVEENRDRVQDGVEEDRDRVQEDRDRVQDGVQEDRDSDCEIIFEDRDSDCEIIFEDRDQDGVEENRDRVQDGVEENRDGVEEDRDRVQDGVEEDRDSDCEIVFDDSKYCDLSLECDMNPDNCIPLDGQDFNNTSICFTEEHLIPGSYEICESRESSES